MLQLLLNLFFSFFLMKAMAVPAQVVPMPIGPEMPQAQPVKVERRASSTDSLGVKVSASNYIVVEPETGAVLAEKKSSESRSIASITKLMTVLVFLNNNPGWDAEYTMKEGDFRVGAKPVFSVGDKVKVKDLFYATLVASSNEGAVALANSTGLNSEQFAKQMNYAAKYLEMNNSFFIEPSGLNSGNKASARDLVKLVSVSFTHAEARKAAATKDYDIKIINKDIVRHIESTDKILREDFGFEDKNYKLEAGKTGFLNSAGYCFVSQVSDESGRRLIIAVLGSSSIYDRFIDTKSLAYWSFNNFDW